MPASKEKRNQMIEAYKIHKTTLSSMMAAVDEIIDGTPESTACLHNGLDLGEFRRLFNRNIFLTDNDNANATIESKYNDGYDWRDQLMSVVMGTDCYVIDDWEDAYEYCIKHLTERQQVVVRLYYEEHLSLEEIGQRVDLTRERVRQILHKAIIQLRHPHWRNILLYGLDEYNKLAELQTNIIKKENAIDEYKDRLKNVENELNAIKTAYDDDVIKDIEAKYAALYNITPSSDRNLTNISLYEMNLSIRSYNVLHKQGIMFASDLLGKNFIDLIQMRNMGLHSAKEVVEKMRTLGATKFASDMESYLDGTRNVRHSYATDK